MNPIKIQFRINMSTENVFVELFAQTKRTSSLSDGNMTSNLFSSLHHYDLCHIICSVWCCIQHPYTLLLCWFTHCTQHKCGRSRGSEPLEWIPQPSKTHFFARGWNKCHDQNVYKWVKSLRVYQIVLLCECFDCLAIFSEAILLFFGVIFIFHTFVFEVLFHTVKLYPSIWIE